MVIMFINTPDLGNKQAAEYALAPGTRFRAKGAQTSHL